MYADDTHPDMKGLNKAQKDELCDSLFKIHQKGEVQIIPQNLHYSRFELLKRYLQAYRFNYYIRPLPDREGSKIHSRLTLALQSSKVKDVLHLLAEMVRDNPDIIRGKIWSPNLLGTKTDTFIFYSRVANIGEARKLAEQLNGISTIKQALIDHTPMGMKSLAPGVSYSEFSSIIPVGGILHSSHGHIRSYILASAIAKWAEQKNRTERELNRYIAQEFRMCGYDPKDCALLSKESNGARTQ
ncbi:T3SS effector HopA1 family protein [Vibrio aestuarianus]|uniref:T3SS effector HopA1 family protein n=2 Tax=Vibrio aestuarianus TaxID=28171 RepID=A0A9X4J1B6_9VIBR|nr:T3SS effector HopA1 family protein [Vibrio aestuarianus]